MFWKKSQSQQPNLNSLISGTTVAGSQIQVTQAGQNATATQSGNLSAQQQGMTGADVVKLLEALEVAVRGSGVDETVQQRILNPVGAAKDEAQREESDKEMIAKNLKRASETLETLNKGADASKNLWEKGQAIFGAIVPWLGVAAKFL